MNQKEVGALFSLAALWGSSFLFLRIASPALGPFLTIGLRVLIAGLALLIYAKATKRKIRTTGLLKKYLILGALNAAIPFTLISTATIYLNASFASILNSTTPLFAAVFAWMLLKETLNLRKVIGLTIGLCGVVVLVGWDVRGMSAHVFLPAFLSILAAAFYAVAGIYVKKTFVGVDTLSLATGQQLGAAVVMLPFAMATFPSGELPSVAIWAVIGVALLGTSLAYLLYFYLIANVGPTKTLSVTYLVPIFGMVWGAIFLNEPITINMVLGLLVILMGISLLLNIRLGQRTKVAKATGPIE